MQCQGTCVLIFFSSQPLVCEIGPVTPSQTQAQHPSDFHTITGSALCLECCFLSWYWMDAVFEKPFIPLPSLPTQVLFGLKLHTFAYRILIFPVQ